MLLCSHVLSTLRRRMEVLGIEGYVTSSPFFNGGSEEDMCKTWAGPQLTMDIVLITG